MKVEHEALFSSGQKAMLPVGTIISDRANEASKRAVKLMGKDASRAEDTADERRSCEEV